MGPSWYIEEDLLERKERPQLEKRSWWLAAQVEAGVFMDVLTLG
jgi:hypothetical protein